MSWAQDIRYRIQPRVLFGLHACDINALLKLDKVFARDLFPSPYYVSRRKNTVIVGIDHMPCAKGFCRSVGADTVTHGFDLFFTGIGDRWFVAIDSDRGYNLLQHGAQFAEPCGRDRHTRTDHTRARVAGRGQM